MVDGLAIDLKIVLLVSKASSREGNYGMPK
jgi:hypothetical protein